MVCVEELGRAFQESRVDQLDLTDWRGRLDGVAGGCKWFVCPMVGVMPR